jgi:hypothetical protein
MIDVFPVREGEQLHIVFENSNSQYVQGIFLKTDMGLVVNEQLCPSAQLWQDTAPDTVLVECHTRNGLLYLYNTWRDGSRRGSQSWSSGMLVEDLPKGRRYRCNDFGIETNFDKLVFRVEWLSEQT